MACKSTRLNVASPAHSALRQMYLTISHHSLLPYVLDHVACDISERCPFSMKKDVFDHLSSVACLLDVLDVLDHVACDIFPIN